MSRFGWWVLLVILSLALIGLDVITGPYLLFPITFVAPVCLAAWRLGGPAGIGVAVVLVIARLGVLLGFEPGRTPLWASTVNACIRMVVLVGLAGLVAKVAQQRAALAARVQALEGILPICGFCKKICRQDGQGEQIEAYITRHSQAQFSTGFCEACGWEHYPDLAVPTTPNPAGPGAAPSPGST